jgi:hypothetical protein
MLLSPNLKSQPFTPPAPNSSVSLHPTMKKLFSLLILLILSKSVFAIVTTNYVSQLGSGNNSGSDPADCLSESSVNASWPTTPGNVLALVGVFTNNTVPLTVGLSGTSSNPVIIYLTPGSGFIAGTWPNNAIRLVAKNYITIDGGQNGYISCTNNGSQLANAVVSGGISASASSFFTVKNLTVTGMYQRTLTTDEGANITDTGAIGDQCDQAPGFISSYTVSNCIIADAYLGIYSDFGAGCSNYVFVANTITRCNWSLSCYDRGSNSTMTNLIVSRNNLSNFTNWNDTVGDDYHHNALHAFTASGGTLTGIKCFGNTIGPDFGGSYSTSGFFYDSAGGTVADTRTYNNLFLCHTNDGPANGLITLSGQNHLIVNNTFIGGNGGFSAIDVGGVTATVENNLIVNGPTDAGAASIANNNDATGNNLTCDYNVIFNSGPTPFSQSSSGSSNPLTFAQWQALGYDTHGTTNNPNLNGSYIPQPTSSAINAGANLTNLGIAGLDTDLAGNSRPASGPWEIGAFQYVSGGGNGDPEPGGSGWLFLLVK